MTDARQTTSIRSCSGFGALWTLFAVCLLGLICSATRAQAQEEQPEPQPAPLVDVKDAELHAKLASALYKAGNYLEAATELNVAYALQPQPVYLFNIAQAYRKALRAQAAKVMYGRFLEIAPNHALAQEARGYMNDMDFGSQKNRANLSAYESTQRQPHGDLNHARGAPTSGHGIHRGSTGG